MNKLTPHCHCQDCGKVLLPGKAIYDFDLILCAQCFENRDIAAMPHEGLEAYLKSKEV